MVMMIVETRKLYRPEKMKEEKKCSKIVNDVNKSKKQTT